MTDWWSELDEAVLHCLAAGVAAPGEIGRQLGMSESAAASILTMLAGQGKVRIARVSLMDGAASVRECRVQHTSTAPERL